MATSEDSLISDIREKIDAYFEFPRLAKKFELLNIGLTQLRYGCIVEASTFSNLRRDCDLLLHKSSLLVSDSHELVKSFETECVQIKGYIEDISKFVEKGMIELVSNRFKSIQDAAETMERKSEEMVKKFKSFYEDLLKAVDVFHSRMHAASKKREHLSNVVEKLNSEHQKNQKKLQDLQKWLAEHKDKIPELPKPNTWQYYISGISEIVIGIFSVKYSERDRKYEKVKQKLEEKESAKQKTLEALSEHEVKRKKKEKNIDNLKVVVDILEDGIHAINDLSATMIKASFFWRSMKEYCSRAFKVTSDTKADLDVVETKSELVEVEPSINRATELWEVFGEVCSLAKSQLEKARDDLIKAMAEKISPAEAESYLQSYRK